MTRWLVLALLYCPLGLAQGHGDRDEAPVKVPEIGSETRALLQLQRSGAQASEERDRLPPEAAARARARMLESYSHPIPAQMADPDQSAN